MKIRVVHIIWDLASIGGAEKLLLHFAKNLDGQKFHVSFISLMKKGEIGSALERLGFQVYALEVSLKKAWNPWITLGLFRTLKKLNPHVVHTHLNYSGIIAAKMAKTPLVVNHIHNIYPDKSKLKISIERVLFGMADVSIAVSSNAAIFTSEQLRRPLNIEVVRNGIDMSVLQITKTKTEVRRELCIDEDEQLILSVGALGKQKGQAYLIAAYARLMPAFPRTRLIIVGEGSLRDSLNRQILGLGMEKHIYLAGLRNDVPNLLNTASIFVLPSLWEGIPIALLEAMYFKLPCIASNVGGVGEVVEDGKDGMLVEPSNETALVSKVERLLKDKSLSCSLGENAYAKVKGFFTVDRTMREIEQIYVRQLDKKKGANPSFVLPVWIDGGQ